MFGAGFVAAKYSTVYKVRDIHIAQNAPRNLFAKVSSGEEVLFDGLLLDRKEEYRAEIVKQFRVGHELRINISEAEPSTGSMVEAESFWVRGVDDVVKICYNKTLPTITISLALDRFGLLTVRKATAKFSMLLTRQVKPSKSKESHAGETVEDVVEQTRELDVLVHYPYFSRLGTEELKRSLQTLDSLEEAEEAARQRAKARKEYEAAVHKARDWLNTKENQKFAVPEARAAILQRMADVSFEVLHDYCHRRRRTCTTRRRTANSPRKTTSEEHETQHWTWRSCGSYDTNT